MPTYDYKCTKCGHVFEYFQGINAPHLNECPKCKGHLKRLIGTGSGIIFKGTGFYITDYKNKSHVGKTEKQKPATTNTTPTAPAKNTTNGAAKPAKKD